MRVGPGGYFIADDWHIDPDTVVHQTLADLGHRDHVVVPHAELPAMWALKVAALAHRCAAELGIETPHISFFAEVTADLAMPWLERVDPDLRATYFFRCERIHGFAVAAEGRIWVNVDSDELELVDVIAHEVAHIAGFSEPQARAIGREARDQRGG